MSITIIDRLNRLAWLIYELFYHLVQFTRHVDTLQIYNDADASMTHFEHDLNAKVAFANSQ